MTKDRDFRDSHLLTRSPRRLLVVATGNITNDALLALLAAHREGLAAAALDAEYSLNVDQLADLLRAAGRLPPPR